MAREGNAEAVEIIRVTGWNINANIGGSGRRVSVSSSGNITRRVARRIAQFVTRGARRFGVEAEFNGATPQAVVNTASALGGIAMNVESYNHAVRESWKIVSDASCGSELVSPPMSGQVGHDQIKVACRALSASNARVDRRCGLHVHIEARDLDANAARRVVRNYTANQALIDSLLAPSRRNNRFALPWNDFELRQIENCATIQDVARAQSGRYKTVNFASFPRYGTIEFRQHQGTQNAEKISNWVKLLDALIDISTRREIGRCANLDAFLNALELDAETKSYFIERAMELAQ